jgi:hypothetical protein
LRRDSGGSSEGATSCQEQFASLRDLHDAAETLA